MNNQLYLAVLSGLACVLGTFFGAFLSLFFKSKSKKLHSMLLEFSGGLMLSVIFLDLIEQAVAKTNILNVTVGILLGIFLMNLTKSINNFAVSNQYLHTGIVLSIGLAMHNLPEGLVLGSAINIDSKLFLTLLLSIFVHDIPEGMLVGFPLKLGGMSNIPIILISILTGFFALLGAILGVNFENVHIIGSLLSIASGAMLFIIFFEIIPTSKRLYSGRFSSFCNILGIILGIVLSNIL